jgi:hypothetical protein
VFYADVLALGLASNYQVAHPSLSLREAIRTLSAATLLERLKAVLPDGYCRRTKTTWEATAQASWHREDVAERLRAEAAANCSAQKEEEEEEEDVVLFNGDRYCGRWRFGRRHGRGVYHFSSGAAYEGEWRDGEMVGWGVYVSQDGRRRNIRH